MVVSSAKVELILRLASDALVRCANGGGKVKWSNEERSAVARAVYHGVRVRLQRQAEEPRRKKAKGAQAD